MATVSDLPASARPVQRIIFAFSFCLSAFDIKPVDRGGNELKIMRLRDYLKTRTPASNGPVRSPAAVLCGGVELLLNRNVPVEEEYVGLVRALVSLCPAVLGDGAMSSQADASGLIDKIAVFNDCYADIINPTHTGAMSKKMLGTYLVELGFVSQAPADQNAGPFPGKRLGDILQAKGIITGAQLDQDIELHMVDSLEQ